MKLLIAVNRFVVIAARTVWHNFVKVRRGILKYYIAITPIPSIIITEFSFFVNIELVLLSPLLHT